MHCASMVAESFFPMYKRDTRADKRRTLQSTFLDYSGPGKPGTDNVRPSGKHMAAASDCEIA